MVFDGAMKKKNSIIKQMSLSLIILSGFIIYKVLGSISITFLMISAILFVLSYFLMKFWYPKEARIYGIVIAILLGISLIYLLK